MVPRSLCASVRIENATNNAAIARMVVTFIDYLSFLEAQTHAEPDVPLVVLTSHIVRARNGSESVERQNRAVRPVGDAAYVRAAWIREVRRVRHVEDFHAELHVRPALHRK